MMGHANAEENPKLIKEPIVLFPGSTGVEGWRGEVQNQPPKKTKIALIFDFRLEQNCDYNVFFFNHIFIIKLDVRKKFL